MNLLIGSRIREARKSKGLTQKELADALSCQQSYISNLEKGESEGTPSQLYEIARILDVSVASLYGEESSIETKRLSELLAVLSPEELAVINKVMVAFVELHKVRHEATS
ncbi:helix-turn-helix domain-containing protein [Beggiatoa leptomitoformis]|nr:helix-turn-helix transcriptional regulator [Beggiatoa leptomitoformis]